MFDPVYGGTKSSPPYTMYWDLDQLVRQHSMNASFKHSDTTISGLADSPLTVRALTT